MGGLREMEIKDQVAAMLGLDPGERCVDLLRGYIEDRMADEYWRGHDDGLREGEQGGYERGYDVGYVSGEGLSSAMDDYTDARVMG